MRSFFQNCLAAGLPVLFFFNGVKPAPNNSPSPLLYPSYDGLVMAGYQGWFNAPEDGSGRGWYHYGRNGVFGPGSEVIDLWPDLTGYKKTYRTNLNYADGKPAFVFSSYDSSTVDLHFKWMKDYGIDGVFMQRFAAEVSGPSGKNHFNKVLDNAMAAAEKYHRAICIMYDLSGIRPGGEQTVLRDIDELSAKYNLADEKKCPRIYLHHHGKPLIAIWGVGFNDHRQYGFKEAEILIDGMKARGFSVLLGVPTYWRNLEKDAIPDTELHQLIRKCDIVLPWFVGRYNAESYPRFRELLKKDIAWCGNNGVDYVPLVFPGFSWKNLQGRGTQSIPRERGRFFWEQVAGAKWAGAKMLYIAMFDEMNEGTAIFKCATKSRLPLNGKNEFVGIADDLGSDYYLWLAGQAARWFHGARGYGTRLPQRRD